MQRKREKISPLESVGLEGSMVDSFVSQSRKSSKKEVSTFGAIRIVHARYFIP